MKRLWSIIRDGQDSVADRTVLLGQIQRWEQTNWGGLPGGAAGPEIPLPILPPFFLTPDLTYMAAPSPVPPSESSRGSATIHPILTLVSTLSL